MTKVKHVLVNLELMSHKISLKDRENYKNYINMYGNPLHKTRTFTTDYDISYGLTEEQLAGFGYIYRDFIRGKVTYQDLCNQLNYLGIEMVGICEQEPHPLRTKERAEHQERIENNAIIPKDLNGIKYKNPKTGEVHSIRYDYPIWDVLAKRGDKEALEILSKLPTYPWEQVWDSKFFWKDLDTVLGSSIPTEEKEQILAELYTFNHGKFGCKPLEYACKRGNNSNDGGNFDQFRQKLLSLGYTIEDIHYFNDDFKSELEKRQFEERVRSQRLLPKDIYSIVISNRSSGGKGIYLKEDPYTLEFLACRGDKRAVETYNNFMHKIGSSNNCVHISENGKAYTKR